jgi:hypothetical protein
MSVDSRKWKSSAITIREMVGDQLSNRILDSEIDPTNPSSFKLTIATDHCGVVDIFITIVHESNNVQTPSVIKFCTKYYTDELKSKDGTETLSVEYTPELPLYFYFDIIKIIENVMNEPDNTKIEGDNDASCKPEHSVDSEIEPSIHSVTSDTKIEDDNDARQMNSASCTGRFCTIS